jgi:hypothetical protein
MTKPAKRNKRHAVDSHLDAPHERDCSTCRHGGVPSMYPPCDECIAQEDGSFMGGWVAKTNGGKNDR